uniref:Ig-like domain-containing protein n=1 Tax=Oncorhynchus tshawytscha TaxID=74940 RepID=A0A8C8JA07_ONCTS
MFCLPECAGDQVQQQPGGVIATEGGLVTLSCQYNTSANNNNAYLFWFKQEENDFPKHMLSRYSFGSGDNAAGFKERFNASLNAKTQSVPLMIQRLQMSDSAVYYCALRPTVTTGYTAPLQKHCVCTWILYFTVHQNTAKMKHNSLNIPEGPLTTLQERWEIHILI